MESFETNYKPSQAEKSNVIHEFVDTERDVRMLEVAVQALRRRKDALQLELKKPGVSADRQRLRELLTELDRIARALRGRNANLETPSGDVHISSIIDRCLAQMVAERSAEGAR